MGETVAGGWSTPVRGGGAANGGLMVGIFNPRPWRPQLRGIGGGKGGRKVVEVGMAAI